MTIRTGMLLWLLTALASCTQLPAARLQLVDIRLESGGYAVQFDSDVDFLGYYDNDRTARRATNKTFICSPERQPDFNDVLTGKPVAEGSMDLLDARQVGARMVYRYKALLYFERFEHNQFNAIAPNDVDRLLSPGAAMACKVRILVYLGRRYFSDTIYLPNDAVKKLAQQLAQESPR